MSVSSARPTPLSSHPYGIDGKRAACDRCRQRKLRCLPDPSIAHPSSASRCLRCASAGFSCHHSVPGRPGRPPVGRPASSPTSLERPPTLTVSAEIPSPGISEELAAMPEQDFFFSGDISMHEMAIPVAEQSPQNLFDGNPFIEDVTQQYGQHPQGDHLDQSNGNAHMSSDALYGTGGSRKQNRVGTALGSFGIERGRPIRADAHKKLLELNAKLETANTSMDDLNEGPEAASSFNTFAGRVLELSSELLALLVSMMTPAEGSLEKPYSGFLDAESSCADRSLFADWISTGLPPTPDSVVPERKSLSTAMCLQLLTTYILILQLHSTLCTGIQTLIASGERRPLFPTLAIGDFSLAPFAKFQGQLVLQAALDLLGRIESLLGLPFGSRVITPRIEDRDSHHGMLACSMDVQLIQAIIKEDASSRGRCAVREIKQILQSLQGPLSLSDQIRQ